jgi:hypothetical protein
VCGGGVHEIILIFTVFITFITNRPPSTVNSIGKITRYIFLIIQIVLITGDMGSYILVTDPEFPTVERVWVVSCRYSSTILDMPAVWRSSRLRSTVLLTFTADRSVTTGHLVTGFTPHMIRIIKEISIAGVVDTMTSSTLPVSSTVIIISIITILQLTTVQLVTTVRFRSARFVAVQVTVVTDRSVTAVNTTRFITPDINLVKYQTISTCDMLRFIVIAVPVFPTVVRIWEISVSFSQLRTFSPVSTVCCCGCGWAFSCGKTVTLIFTRSGSTVYIKGIVTVTIEGIK